MVKFDVANGNDFYNKMVGHNVLVDDLYALPYLCDGIGSLGLGIFTAATGGRASKA